MSAASFVLNSPFRRLETEIVTPKKVNIAETGQGSQEENRAY
jgi:hypothetical protein